MTKKQRAYAHAGVDVDLGNRLKRQLQSPCNRLLWRKGGDDVLKPGSPPKGHFVIGTR